MEIHAPFVKQMAGQAREAGIANRVHIVCGDIGNIEVAEGSVDLIWAEGSIYLVGIERALAIWRPWLRPGGCIAFSDFVWWTDDPSEEASEFWATEYPDMATEVSIRAAAESSGYRVVSSFHMSKEAHDAYYVPLEGRVAELAGCVDADVQQVLENIRREIEVVRRFADDAGYTFFVLQGIEG